MNQGHPMSGAHGHAVSPMTPSGSVMIDGIEYNARFKSGFADSGDEVVVVGRDAFDLIVDKPDSTGVSPAE